MTDTVVDRFLRYVRIDTQAEHRPLLDGAFVQEQIRVVQEDRHAESPLRGRDAGDVIDVRVGQQDALHRQGASADERQQPVHLVTRIDQHGFAGSLAGHDEAVLEEWSDSLRLDYHQGTS